jgi:hypothetical protein
MEKFSVSTTIEIDRSNFKVSRESTLCGNNREQHRLSGFAMQL